MAKRTPRRFEPEDAKRKPGDPVLVGLTGPSFSGKTLSALKIAAGIQKVVGGKIAVGDSEAGRAAHYAELIPFTHYRFEAPFSANDYLDLIRQMKADGHSIYVIDSMSHEHDGPGGLLEWHEAEVDRLSRGQESRRDAVSRLAWQKPKAARRALINEIVQSGGHFVFCFRAKHAYEQLKKDGKTVIEDAGFMPITGEEFTYEMTMRLYLPPDSGGVPMPAPQRTGEKMATKIPLQFQDFMGRYNGKPIDEELGRYLAEWTGAPKPAPGSGAPLDPRGLTSRNIDGAGESEEDTTDLLELLKQTLRDRGLAGQTDLEKSARAAALREAFGTAEWREIQELGGEALEQGIATLKNG